ncbi:hypothetical protein L1987_21539 [Smallanthus sonchifolius]|uniref:Uncharacterized protein n=1 Tax=Smallanthus sonchifolius TaxID=185202 RepID=A0ACB9IUM4_9ASTR|nr:hypothetical protein L1987_21539 [Smallanthus sonchifolius]
MLWFDSKGRLNVKLRTIDVKSLRRFCRLLSEQILAGTHSLNQSKWRRTFGSEICGPRFHLLALYGGFRRQISKLD